MQHLYEYENPEEMLLHDFFTQFETIQVEFRLQVSHPQPFLCVAF